MSNSGGKKDARNAKNEREEMKRLISVVSIDGNQHHYINLTNLKIVEELWVKGHSVEKKYEPGTIKSYLLTLGHFFDFLIRAKVTPDLPNTLPVNHSKLETLQAVRDEVAKWRSSLRVEEEQRQFDVMVRDGDEMLTKEDFIAIMKNSTRTFGEQFRKFRRSIRPILKLTSLIVTLLQI